jgi:hypothetical protein
VLFVRFLPLLFTFNIKTKIISLKEKKVQFSPDRTFARRGKTIEMPTKRREEQPAEMPVPDPKLQEELNW